MKATGIVRRIDELGRVVIPKEIRRVQHIRSGDSLEIFMEENGEVVFKKYSPLAELGEPAAVYADVLARRLGCGVLVCDREHIVAAAGAGKNELLHRELPPELDRLLKKRRLYTAPANPDRRIRLGGRWLLCAAPILVHGDIEGGVLLPGSARDPLPEAEVAEALAQYPNATVTWVQDEPRNQGTWPHLALNLFPSLGRPVRLGARPESATTAAGRASLHKEQAATLIAQAFEG